MLISVFLLLLFSLTDSTAAEKSGNFGIFSVCKLKNETLRLDCKYAECEGSPSFDCAYMASDGSSITNKSDKDCKLYIPPNHDEAVNYSCILTRKNRPEHKFITIDYPSGKGRTAWVSKDTWKVEKIKRCPSTTGLQLHRAPTLLVMSLSLWRVLVLDGLTS